MLGVFHLVAILDLAPRFSRLFISFFIPLSASAYSLPYLCVQTSRFNNTMLIAALLLSSCISMLLAPPNIERSETSYRMWSFTMFLATLVLFLSLILGSKFIEDCISRNFSASDRVCSIVGQWYALNIFNTFFYFSVLMIMISVMIYVKTIFALPDFMSVSIFASILTIFVFISIMYSNTATFQMQDVHIHYFRDCLCNPPPTKGSASASRGAHGYELKEDLKAALDRKRFDTDGDKTRSDRLPSKTTM
jgi:hypothetical protein